MKEICYAILILFINRLQSLISDCVSDLNSTSYPIANHTNCPYLSTGDPRAGKGECPSNCIKVSLISDCMCDSGSSNYPSATCDKDKKYAFDLANRTQATCPYLSIGDPRSETVCKKTDPIDKEKD
ncbi:MAG: hypothetical protein EZS28_002496 [Streblomastix strix]|uniref:Secreted protein n=1 Tax=Streblomastix strix TaxID=222440 RepID=A0A5J4X599_9EUKA|nr:MAG: hypothetical protein EZS28_002496 [Streblomastix strix]